MEEKAGKTLIYFATNAISFKWLKKVQLNRFSETEREKKSNQLRLNEKGKKFEILEEKLIEKVSTLQPLETTQNRFDGHLHFL